MSLLEASIMLAATAIAASILLPRANETTLRITRTAERALGVGEEMRGEAAFRAVLANANPANADLGGFAVIRGDAFALQVNASGGFCAEGGGNVTLRIANTMRGGRLTCDGHGGTQARTVMTWPVGEARFSYSLDGAAWLTRFDPLTRRDAEAAARLVRFEIAEGARTPVSWIVALGADGAPLAPPERPGERSPLNP